jgi:ribonuclease HII
MDLSELSVIAVRSLIDSLDEVPEELLRSMESDSRAQVRDLAGKLRRRHEAEQEQARIQQEMLKMERAWQARGHRLVAGVDEAGRGPLAGPVVAAAVIFAPDCDPPPARDSKAISEQQRDELFGRIHETAQAVGIGRADQYEIDKLNIHNASILAMIRAVEQLGIEPDALLVDGRMVLKMDVPQEAVIGGDRKCVSIAAASIVAKVTRDREMAQHDRDYPGYGFARHKGYPTADHVKALREFGPCPIHRRTFGQVAECGTFGKGLWAEFYDSLAQAGTIEELDTVGAEIKPRRGALNPGELASLRALYKRRRDQYNGSKGRPESKGSGQ